MLIIMPIIMIMPIIRHYHAYVFAYCAYDYAHYYAHVYAYLYYTYYNAYHCYAYYLYYELSWLLL